jgi:hypothetical protein
VLPPLDYSRRRERFLPPPDAIEPANLGQHMRRVTALSSAHLQIPFLPQPCQQQIKEQQVALPAEQSLPKLDQHRVIKARVAWLQSSHIFPIQPSPDRIGRLPIRQALQKLQHTDQCQPPRSQRRLTALRKEVGKLLILIDRSERITQLAASALKTIEKHLS